MHRFVTAFLTILNCYNVKWVTKVTDVFSLGKVLALVVIIIFGMVSLIQGNFSNLEKPLEGTNYNPGYIALSFYSGIFSFAGWYDNTFSFFFFSFK